MLGRWIEDLAAIDTAVTGQRWNGCLPPGRPMYLRGTRTLGTPSHDGRHGVHRAALLVFTFMRVGTTKAASRTPAAPALLRRKWPQGNGVGDTVTESGRVGHQPREQRTSPRSVNIDCAWRRNE